MTRSSMTLLVGQDVRVAYKGKLLEKTFRVVEITRDYYRLKGDSWSDVLIPLESADYSWVVLGEDRETEPVISITGSRCRRCHAFNEYAEPTRISDRTHICFSCGQDGWGTTWATENGDT